jgi:hypothetical protein
LATVGCACTGSTSLRCRAFARKRDGPSKDKSASWANPGHGPRLRVKTHLAAREHNCAPAVPLAVACSGPTGCPTAWRPLGQPVAGSSPSTGQISPCSESISRMNVSRSFTGRTGTLTTP